MGNADGRAGVGERVQILETPYSSGRGATRGANRTLHLPRDGVIVEREVVLRGGAANAGAVTRVGGVVLRPTTPHTTTIHALLADLHDVGFDTVPNPLGIAPDSRERLAFVPGDVATPPFPAWSVTDEALASVALLLRRFHDARPNSFRYVLCRGMAWMITSSPSSVMSTTTSRRFAGGVGTDDQPMVGVLADVVDDHRARSRGGCRRAARQCIRESLAGASGRLRGSEQVPAPQQKPGLPTARDHVTAKHLRPL